MAYLAPNKDTIVAVGGLGNQTDKAQLNGGGATKTVWDAGSPSDFIDTDGGPKFTAANCTFATATKTLAATGIGIGITVGTLCYVSVGDGPHITEGVYEITTVFDNDNIVCAQIDDDGNDDTGVTVNIGGALDGLQNALDNSVNNGASYNRYIYDNIATETIAATIDADTYGGSDATRIYVIGYNSTLTAKAEVIITTDQDLTTNALLKIATVDYLSFYNIDFNCGGKDGNLGGYGVYGAATGDGQSTVFYKCKFRGAEIDGVYMATTQCLFIRCEMNLNGRYGYNGVGANASSLLGCSVHDNDNHGIYIRPNDAAFNFNLVYDNGKDGTGSGIHFLYGGNRSFFIGNTLHGNADDGVQMHSADTQSVYFNNTSVGNGAYGYDLQGLGFGDFRFFGFNHSSINTTAHYSEGADNTFAAYGNGDNQADTTAAADIFTNVADGSEDFTPKSGTDLIDNALDAEGYGELDIGTIQQAAGAGGLLTHPGMSGGIRG